MEVFFAHPKFAIFFVVLTICCFALVLILPKGESSSSSSSGRKWSKENSIACQQRSDTYHKCGWNMIEDRCVCKVR